MKFIVGGEGKGALKEISAVGLRAVGGLCHQGVASLSPGSSIYSPRDPE